MAVEQKIPDLEALIKKEKEQSGKPIIGYLCCFAPPEMISAAGALPYRLTGQPGADNSAANTCAEPYGCTYVRNILARVMADKMNFLDGLVISHSCDMVQRLYGLWSYYRPLAYSYLFNVPHQLTPWSKDFYQRELHFFLESLEKFTGQKVDDHRLREELKLTNHNRTLIRQIYQMRRKKPSPLEGSEILTLLVQGGALTPTVFNKLLADKLTAVEGKVRESAEKPRILVWGSIIDHPALYQMIEAAGAQVVADDTCIGFRTWNQDIPISEDLFSGLTEHYFTNFQCPRTDRGPGLDRFKYIPDRIREYGVDGVIGYCISFCDPHKFDYPDLRDYLKKEGIPMLLIDDNYSFEPQEALKTRIEAFIELL